MPGYELYIEALRNGVYKDKGRQLRMIIGKDRKVVLTQTL
jgi:D-glycerate 3-kinase